MQNTLQMNARLVTFVVMGREIQATVRNANSDDEARAEIIAQISKSFHVKSITMVKPRRVSLWDTYKGGFLSFYHSIAQ